MRSSGEEHEDTLRTLSQPVVNQIVMMIVSSETKPAEYEALFDLQDRSGSVEGLQIQFIEAMTCRLRALATESNLPKDLFDLIDKDTSLQIIEDLRRRIRGIDNY